MISVGSTVKNIYNDYATFLENRFFSPSIAIIAVGCLVFVVAVFGCYGAVKLSVAAISVVREKLSIPLDNYVKNF